MLFKFQVVLFGAGLHGGKNAGNGQKNGGGQEAA